MGYGGFWDGSRVVAAHRFAWGMEHGSIPEGLHILHRCDNPPCCNPPHLYLGTNADNVADRVSRGRAAGQVGERNPRAKLTEEQVRAIKQRLKNGETQTGLACEYGVHQTAIGFIARGVRWKHVAVPTEY